MPRESADPAAHRAAYRSVTQSGYAGGNAPAPARCGGAPYARRAANKGAHRVRDRSGYHTDRESSTQRTDTAIAGMTAHHPGYIYPGAAPLRHIPPHYHCTTFRVNCPQNPQKKPQKTKKITDWCKKRTIIRLHYGNISARDATTIQRTSSACNSPGSGRRSSHKRPEGGRLRALLLSPSAFADGNHTHGWSAQVMHYAAHK